MYEYANARVLLQVGAARHVMNMTAQASTIAMATASVLALTRVSVHTAGVDRAVSSRHAGMTSSFQIFIQPVLCHISAAFINSM